MALHGKYGEEQDSQGLQYAAQKKRPHDSEASHHQAAGERAHEGGDDAEDLADGSDLDPGETHLDIEGRGHGAADRLADLVAEHEQQDDDPAASADEVDQGRDDAVGEPGREALGVGP